MHWRYPFVPQRAGSAHNTACNMAMARADTQAYTGTASGSSSANNTARCNAVRAIEIILFVIISGYV